MAGNYVKRGCEPECEMGGHDINAAREGNLVHVVQNRMHRLQLVATSGDALSRGLCG